MPRPQNFGLVSDYIPAADWLKVIDVVSRQSYNYLAVGLVWKTRRELSG